MRKTLSALLLVCAFSFSLVGCSGRSSSSSPTDPSWNTIRSKDTLVVGVEENFEPLSFYDKEGNLTGFAVETAREVGKELGVAVEFKTIQPCSAQDSLSNGEIDCFWSNYSKATQDSEAANLTFGYMKSSQVIFALADAPLNNLADLKGQRVGVKEGSGGQKAVEASTTFKSCLGELGTYRDYVQAKTSLDNKKISAVIMDEVSAEYYLKQSPERYRILGKNSNEPPETLETGDYSVAFRQSDESLTLKIQEALNELSDDGTITKLSKKWFGTDLSSASSSL
ncbi:transporter substrate-binding domain-containing protein [Clostridium minihomine]|uniref:transporter substrate-binding domain-containing protein n=1 Tax=Clostridium minihomine TaxID=2045012 RepID=UPI000C7641FF|nr:transporter substrate-binding domain-containing protein [Clostridium minihomine]